MPDSFWENELPPAELVTEPTTVDDTTIVNPPDNACPTCGLEIVRLPGQKGRLPKYHPECKPARGRSSVTGTTRVVKVSKQEELIAIQVELALEQFKRHLARAVGLLSLVDPYDAFVLHINAPEILNNLRAVLMRFEWLRNAAAAAQTGGSIFGLVTALVTTLLPIAAHHGWIPSKKVAGILHNIPFFMLRLQRAVANGDDEQIEGELLRRIREEGTKQQERVMRKQTADANGRSDPRQVP